MKVQRKTNSDYSREKNERLKKGIRRSRIRTLETQENTKKNQSNILLRHNKERRKRICERMSNLSTGTNIQGN